jgi:hypothetical protein
MHIVFQMQALGTRCLDRVGGASRKRLVGSSEVGSSLGLGFLSPVSAVNCTRQLPDCAWQRQ